MNLNRNINKMNSNKQNKNYYLNIIIHELILILYLLEKNCL